MRRGYRVVLSTHSPVVLDMVWALQEFKKLGSSEASVRQVFDLPSTPDAKKIAQSALTKDYAVYYFDRDGSVRVLFYKNNRYLERNTVPLKKYCIKKIINSRV